MVYTVTFNPSLDYIVSVEDFRLGLTNRTDSEVILPGGKGLNVSIVLSNLGIENTALGFVAGFTGEEIVRRVEGMGVKSDFIRLREGISRINLKLKSIDGTEINGRGPRIGREAVGELILQPQSELGEFRAFLRRAGYVLVQEDAVFEEGKYYFAMKACPDNSSAAGSLTAENGESARRREELADRFGGLLLEAAHPVLLGYLRQREAHLRQVESSLGAADSRRAEEALAGIRRELTDIELAYEICGSGRGEGSSPA